MLKITLGIICLGVVASAVWRFASDRTSIPCPAWLGWLVEMDNPFCKVQRASAILDNAGIEEGMRVLDAGCGPGRVTLPVLNRVGKTGSVVAMDIQKDMLKKTRSKIKQGQPIEFLHAGLGDGKLEKESFDRALLVTVLGEIPDREPAMKELYEALKPGGILSITEIIFDPHFQRKSKVVELADEAGFTFQERFGGRFAYTLNFVK